MFTENRNIRPSAGDVLIDCCIPRCCEERIQILLDHLEIYGEEGYYGLQNTLCLLSADTEFDDEERLQTLDDLWDDCETLMQKYAPEGCSFCANDSLDWGYFPDEG